MPTRDRDVAFLRKVAQMGTVNRVYDGFRLHEIASRLERLQTKRDDAMRALVQMTEFLYRHTDEFAALLEVDEHGQDVLDAARLALAKEAEPIPSDEAEPTVVMDDNGRMAFAGPVDFRQSGEPDAVEADPDPNALTVEVLQRDDLVTDEDEQNAEEFLRTNGPQGALFTYDEYNFEAEPPLVWEVVDDHPVNSVPSLSPAEAEHGLPNDHADAEAGPDDGQAAQPSPAGEVLPELPGPAAGPEEA